MEAEPRYCDVCGGRLTRRRLKTGYDPITGLEKPRLEQLICGAMWGGWIEGHACYERRDGVWGEALRYWS